MPRGAAALTASAPLLETDPYGLARRPRGAPLTQYGAILAPPAAARPAASALADAERGDTLALPPRVDPRVVGLARELARQAEGPRGRLAATVRPPAGPLPLHARARGVPDGRPPRRVPLREEGRRTASTSRARRSSSSACRACPRAS